METELRRRRSELLTLGFGFTPALPRLLGTKEVLLAGAIRYLRVSLLGMDRGRRWSLLANLYDKTLMRNYIAYYLAGQMGPPLYLPVPLRGGLSQRRIPGQL